MFYVDMSCRPGCILIDNKRDESPESPEINPRLVEALPDRHWLEEG